MGYDYTWAMISMPFTQLLFGDMAFRLVKNTKQPLPPFVDLAQEIFHMSWDRHIIRGRRAYERRDRLKKAMDDTFGGKIL